MSKAKADDAKPTKAANPAVAPRRPSPLAALTGSLAKSQAAHVAATSHGELDEQANKLARNLAVELIDPSPWQPRKIFDEKKLKELADLIDAQGLLQPIEVRAVGERYQLVSGERRLRAHKLLGKRFILATVVVITDEDASARSLVENLGRENLTDYEVFLSIKTHRNQFGDHHGWEHFGVSRTHYFRLMSFDSFPDAVNQILQDKPDLISAYAAEETKKAISQEVEKGADQSKLESALKTVLQQALNSGKKIVNLVGAILAIANPGTPVTPVKTSLKFSGGVAGEITNKGKYTQVKLNHAAFTEEKLAKIEAYLAEILSE